MSISLLRGTTALRRKRSRVAAAAVALFIGAAALTACGDDSGSDSASTIKVVNGWVVQPEFASVYAAKALGYYSDAGLDVDIQAGGPDINAEQLVGSGSAQFGLDAGSNVFTANDSGAGLVTVAQLEPHSSLRLISRASAGLEEPADWKGKRIGVWSSANSLYASLAKHDINKDTDVTLVEQGYDMSQFLNGEIDLASAYSYNELGQVLQSGVPLNELTVYDYQDDDTATIGLSLFGNGDYVSENPDQAADFVAATLKGQTYCRDNPQECVKIVGEAGATIDEDFMLWQMNEVNKSVWSSDTPLGTMNNEDFQKTATVLADTGVISQTPDLNALMATGVYDSAVAKLADTDLASTGFTPLTNLQP